MSPKQDYDSPKAKRVKTQSVDTPIGSNSPSIANSATRNTIAANGQIFANEAFQTWIACGKCANTYGAADVAINSFNAALKYDPYNKVALCGLASASRTKDIKENSSDFSAKAVLVITNCLQQVPEIGSDSEFWKELAECYLITGFADQAHAALQRAIQLNSSDSSLWLLNGQSLVRAGINNGAIQSLEQALRLIPDQISPENVDVARAVHAELAAIHASEGDIDAATYELQITLSLPPPPPERTDELAALWCALATACERANDIGAAIQACTSASKRMGDNPRVLINLAYLLLLKGSQYFNPTEAISLLEKVLHMESNQASTYIPQANADDYLPVFLLGYAYTTVESFKEAYDAYQLALRRCPSSPIPWLGVGALYLHLGQLGDALSAYSQAARLQAEEQQYQQQVNKAMEIAAATAWEGLACVYERCDDQANDAADACLRASACYKTVGESELSNEALKRADMLRAVAKREIANPVFKEATVIPPILLRDLVPLSQAERVEMSKEPNLKRTSHTHIVFNESNGTSHQQQQTQQQQTQPQHQQLPPQQIPSQQQTPQFASHQLAHEMQSNTSPYLHQQQHQAQHMGPPPPPAYDSYPRRLPPHQIPSNMTMQGTPQNGVPPPPPQAQQQHPYGGGQQYYNGQAPPPGTLPQMAPQQQQQQQQQQQHGIPPPGFQYHQSFAPPMGGHIPPPHHAHPGHNQLTPPKHYQVPGEWR